MHKGNNFHVLQKYPWFESTSCSVLHAKNKNPLNMFKNIKRRSSSHQVVLINMAVTEKEQSAQVPILAWGNSQVSWQESEFLDIIIYSCMDSLLPSSLLAFSFSFLLTSFFLLLFFNTLARLLAPPLPTRTTLESRNHFNQNWYIPL